jgi:hypothetical protein
MPKRASKTVTLELTKHDAVQLWDLLDRNVANSQTLRWVRDRLARAFSVTLDKDIEIEAHWPDQPRQRVD